MGLQDILAFGVVLLVILYWVKRWTLPFLARPLSEVLLRRGHVALAMRLRFGSRGRYRSDRSSN